MNIGDESLEPAVRDAAALTRTDYLHAALGIAATGCPVFPCLPRGKRPLTTHGFRDATSDLAQVRCWWTDNPQANIAIPTGAGTFDVLDVDVRTSGTGWAAYEQLLRLGLLFGAVRLVGTPSGGIHLYYPGTGQVCASLRDAHIDLKTTGGYVLVPPSYVLTTDYSGYYVELDRRKEGRPLDWTAVRRVLASERRPAATWTKAYTGDLRELASWLERQAEGNRNRALFWAACRALESGRTQLDELVAAAVHAGLPLDEIERTIRSAALATGVKA